jgi:hypothetical protein
MGLSDFAPRQIGSAPEQTHFAPAEIGSAPGQSHFPVGQSRVFWHTRYSLGGFMNCHKGTELGRSKKSLEFLCRPSRECDSWLADGVGRAISTCYGQR